MFGGDMQLLGAPTKSRSLTELQITTAVEAPEFARAPKVELGTFGVVAGEELKIDSR